VVPRLTPEGDWAAVTAGTGGRRLAETAGKLTGSVTGINTSTILTELEKSVTRQRLSVMSTFCVRRRTTSRQAGRIRCAEVSG